MTFVSYAQNFEDVILRRAFRDISVGRYLDIGAQDPVIDSVSLAFYETGWRGIHVEPTSAYAARLREARPDEVVIEAVVTDAPGAVTFFEIPDTGISTGREDVASHHAKMGYESREVSIPAVRLDALFEMSPDEIHWMKIDVEGMEADVLRSWGEGAQRPWVLVVEATYPTTQERTEHLWIDEVLRRGYRCVLFDGLSCYFLHQDHDELTQCFDCPPNIFDDFIITTPHFAAARIRGEMEAANRARDEEWAKAGRLAAEVEETSMALDAARRDVATTCERLVNLEQAHRQLIQDSSERERMLNADIRLAEADSSNARVELARLEERNSQLDDKLDRSDARVIEQQREIADLRSSSEQMRLEFEQRITQLGAELARADAMIKAVVSEKPGRWQRVGEILQLARPPRALQLLSAWREVALTSDRPAVSQHDTREALSTMRSSVTNELPNPYLRANSLAELLSWQDVDFVRCAYVTVLGRQPDPDGEQYYVDRLRRGYSKYGILWQLRTSREGPGHDPGIAGFDKELRKHRNARSRIWGWLVRWITGREADTRLERRIRAVENLVGALPKSIHTIDIASVVRESVSAEIHVLSEGLQRPDKGPTVGANVGSLPQVYDVVRGRLSPSGQRLFDRIL